MTALQAVVARAGRSRAAPNGGVGAQSPYYTCQRRAGATVSIDETREDKRIGGGGAGYHLYDERSGGG